MANRTTAHLVSTSVDHVGFGHGQQACPGRFFAASEIKIVFVYLLLSYDWKLPDGAVPKDETIWAFVGIGPET